MKINNFGSSGVNPYNRQFNRLDNAEKSKKNSADKIEISSTAKEMQHISQYAASRQEKVEALKIQVENGNYNVNPKEVAKNILDFYKK